MFGLNDVLSIIITIGWVVGVTNAINTAAQWITAADVNVEPTTIPTTLTE